LYYNGLSIYGREKLKPLIEKYALLNNIDKESLSISKDLNVIIPNVRPSAFCHTSQEYEEAKTALSNYKKFLAKRITSQPI
jgi:hypothetical protein